VNSSFPNVPGVPGLNPSRTTRRGLSRRMFIGGAAAALTSFLAA
jgi:hypothetical protein